MNIINLSSEALELVNQLCDPDNLADKITVLDAAEEQLQQLACNELEPQEGYNLYDVAYTMKRYKKEFLKLKNLIEDGSQGI